MKRIALLLLAGCAGAPAVREAPELLIAGRPREAVTLYAKHAAEHGEDRPTIAAMATGTLALGLRAAAPRVQLAAIRAIERLEIERLAADVARLIGADDATVSAAAAAALLRSHP